MASTKEQAPPIINPDEGAAPQLKQDDTPKTFLSTLPAELILIIHSFLPLISDKQSLRHTCRGLYYSVLPPPPKITTYINPHANGCRQRFIWREKEEQLEFMRRLLKDARRRGYARDLILCDVCYAVVVYEIEAPFKSVRLEKLELFLDYCTRSIWVCTWWCWSQERVINWSVFWKKPKGWYHAILEKAKDCAIKGKAWIHGSLKG